VVTTEVSVLFSNDWLIGVALAEAKKMQEFDGYLIEASVTKDGIRLFSKLKPVSQVAGKNLFAAMRKELKGQ